MQTLPWLRCTGSAVLHVKEFNSPFTLVTSPIWPLISYRQRRGETAPLNVSLLKCHFPYSNLFLSFYQIVNFYFELLRERGKQDDFPSVHVFNTFFYPKVRLQYCICKFILLSYWVIYIRPPLSKKLFLVFRVGEKTASREVGIFFFS